MVMESKDGWLFSKGELAGMHKDRVNVLVVSMGMWGFRGAGVGVVQDDRSFGETERFQTWFRQLEAFGNSSPGTFGTEGLIECNLLAEVVVDRWGRVGEVGELG